MSDTRRERATEQVESFLAKNFPCGCDAGDDCPGWHDEASTLVDIVLDNYRKDARDD